MKHKTWLVVLSVLCILNAAVGILLAISGCSWWRSLLSFLMVVALVAAWRAEWKGLM